MSMIPCTALTDGSENQIIDHSIRFNGINSYLNRAPAVDGNRRTWSWSGWVKKSAMNMMGGSIFGAGQAVVNFGVYFGFGATTVAGDQVNISINGIGSVNTTIVFRDPSAWNHLLLVFDTTQQADKQKLFVDGKLAAVMNVGALNAEYAVNQATVNQFLGFTNNGNKYLTGYLADVHLIDGQALTPDAFGYFDAVSGQWRPKKYTGTYGVNGFHLDFNDGSSAAALGKDVSGNGHDFTVNNMVRAAGVTDCWMTDTPTKNYPTANILRAIVTGLTIDQAALHASTATDLHKMVVSTQFYGKGKWYAEFKSVAIGATYTWVGAVAIDSTPFNQPVGYAPNGYAYGHGGSKMNNAVAAAYGATYGNNDVIGVALDKDAGTIEFFKNGVSQGVAYTGLTNDPMSFACSIIANPVVSINLSSIHMNFGQREWEFPPPAGFNGMNTADARLVSLDAAITSGSFSGNANANGPFIYTGGCPETLTIGGSAVVWGTHADRLANGFKLRTAAAPYNSTGAKTWVATYLPYNQSLIQFQNAKGN